jgi:hypothetical protein
MEGIPADWPDGHKWVSHEDSAECNCTPCLEVLPNLKNPVTSRTVFLTRDRLGDCPVKMWFGERPQRRPNTAWYTKEPHNYLLIDVDDFMKMFRNRLRMEPDHVLEIEIKWKEVSRGPSKEQ